MREDMNEIYNMRRCVVCGVPWDEHDHKSICDRHRPMVAPPWLAETLERHGRARAACGTASNFQMPTIDDAEKARREVAGGTPTREWATDGETYDHV
jgi:hypothetical protein